jgi:DNA-binding phage protein
MLTINEVKQRLTDANLRRVAVKAGVHPATVYRFMQPDSQPSYETVKLLSDYLTGQEAVHGQP